MEKFSVVEVDKIKLFKLSGYVFQALSFFEVSTFNVPILGVKYSAPSFFS